MDATESYRVFSPDHESTSFIISNTRPTELLIMTIDLGEGLKDKIVVYEEDEPRTVARQFCLRHGLGPQIQQALLSSIIENLEFEETQPNSLHTSQDCSQAKKYSTPQKTQSRSNSIDKKFNSTGKKRLNFNEESSHMLRMKEKPKQPPRGRPGSKPNDRVNRSGSRTNCKSTVRSDVNESVRINKSSPSRVNQSCNIAHRLYYKGIKKKEVQDRKIENLRKEKSEKELTGITFKPNLTPSSLINVKRPDEPVENFLLKQAAEKQKVLEAKRKEKLKSELKGCTFNPEVNKNSVRMAKKHAQNQSPDRFVALYNEAGARQERNHKLTEQIFHEKYTFRPNTSICSEKEDFVNRSFKQSDKLLTFQKDIDEIPHKDLNTVSSRKLFLPLNQRKIQENQDESCKPSNKRCKSTEHLKPVYIEPKDMSPSKDKNEKILQRVRMERFRRIFDSFSHDEFGFIDHAQLNQSKLDSDLDSVLQTVFIKMQDLEVKLSFENFCDFMEKLIREVTPEERRIILFEKRKAPETSVVSKSKSPPPPRGESTYERLAHYQKVTNIQLRDIKLEHERKLKQEVEISHCTFKPVINKTCYEGSMSQISLFKDNPE